MSKKILKCPNCKGEVDITEYPPGMKFTCPNCQATLQVPRQQPTAGAKPNLVQGTGFNKIPAQIKQTPVRPPASGASNNRPGVPAARSKYAPTMKVDRQAVAYAPPYSQQNYNSDKQKKSFLPLYIGGILALMVIGVIAGVLIVGSGGEKKGNNGLPATNNGGDVKQDDKIPETPVIPKTPDTSKPVDKPKPLDTPKPPDPEPPVAAGDDDDDNPPEPPEPVDPPMPPVKLPPPVMNPNPAPNPAINQDLKEKILKMFANPHPKDATEEQNTKRRTEIVALGKEAFPVCADILGEDDGYIAKECGKVLIELLPAGDYRSMMQGTLTFPETAPKQSRADVAQRMIRFYVGHGKDVIK
ncbi:MAG: hypothetical protein HZA48_00385 [Planctomycetes bacterium]|nr:hypothetical protein [Planctomycetota bacterium]